MKKLYYIITIMAGVMLFHSCQKLDVAPTDRFTDDNYWTSPGKAELVLNMAYNQMYSADLMWRDEFLSDNMIQTYGASDTRTIRRGEATPALGLFNSEWGNAYGGIKTCLVFLANVDRVPGMDEALKKRMIDEIRFIRAFIYFRLVNYYGDVPFFNEELTLEESYAVKRTSKSEILAFVHSELDAIINEGNLPKADNLATSERGRITIGAACAFQARAYLYENNYTKVKDYAGRLINDQATYGTYALFQHPAKREESYLRLFAPENEYNSEVMLDITYVPNLKTWSHMSQMAPITKRAALSSQNPTQELVDCYYTMNGLPVKGAQRDPSYVENNPYVNRDPRLSATIVYDNYKWLNKDGTTSTIRTAKGSGTDDAYISAADRQTKTGYYVRKYYDWDMGENMQAGLNIIMFRYADVLLMYAEACNELAKITQQEWDQTMRPIRSRAGFTAALALDYPAAKNQAEIREVIRNERRVELALEGLRWYDIKRWQIGEQVLRGFMHGFKLGGTDAGIDGGYLRADEFKFNNNRDYLWSVPLQQSDINKNLLPNNPGY